MLSYQKGNEFIAKSGIWRYQIADTDEAAPASPKSRDFGKTFFRSEFQPRAHHKDGTQKYFAMNDSIMTVTSEISALKPFPQTLSLVVSLHALFYRT